MGDRAFYALDVVHAVKIYLKSTALIQQFETLFVHPDRLRKEQVASNSTISRWIHQLMSQAYSLIRRAPPFPAMTHSTRSVCSCWAIEHQASVAQVCKADTWPLVHTFTKFYQVDVGASVDASFGLRVLQEAVWGGPSLLRFLFLGPVGLLQCCPHPHNQCFGTLLS